MCGGVALFRRHKAAVDEHGAAVAQPQRGQHPMAAAELGGGLDQGLTRLETALQTQATVLVAGADGGPGGRARRRLWRCGEALLDAGHEVLFPAEALDLPACQAEKATTEHGRRDDERVAAAAGHGRPPSGHVAHGGRVGRGHHVGVHVVHDPDRARQHDDHQGHREQQGQHGPAALDLGVHVQEVHHVHHHLHGGEAEDDEAGELGVAQHLAHHQPEGDGRQDDRQDEAGGVALIADVEAVVVVVVVVVIVGVVGSHHMDPIR
mmetsp:Transcript_1232/g.3431  ORF Transcript_1232/g.3431 Transcript_1232/m.3431 type:complete len:264 (-) Transcript_1232:2262-3053(-)